MSIFLNRETLYDVYSSADEITWAKQIGYLATEGNIFKSKLYYLSLDSNLNGAYHVTRSFEDNQTDAGDCHYKELYEIALPERLITSTTIQGAWNQIHGKLRYLFGYECDLDVLFNLYLYEVDTTDCLIIDDRSLTVNWLVHDAYINQTHAVFGFPMLKMVNQLTVRNTLSYPDEYCTYYYPYNDSRYMQCLLSTPLEIVYNKTITMDY